MSNSHIGENTEEYQEDIGVEATSSSPKQKQDIWILEWYNDSTHNNASSNSGDVISCINFNDLEINKDLEICNVDGMQLDGYGQEGLSHADIFRTDDFDPPIDLNISRDVISCINFNDFEINEDLEICNVDGMQLDGYGQEGLSHADIFGTDDFDPPIDLNISRLVKKKLLLVNT
nr:hypothetical protein [Tanacetum cinerariifolium]